MATHRDVLVAVAEHGDEHVQQHDDHDGAVGAEHELADELGEVVLLLQLEVRDVDQAVDGEVEGLQDLEQTAMQRAVGSVCS